MTVDGIRHLRVVGPDTTVDVEATIVTEPPYRLRLAFPDGRIVESEGEDLFHALELVRLELEADGLLVCCQGARPDVYPSGMARQMSGGLRAYRHLPDRRPTRDDIVNVFDPADCHEVVTVDAQLVSMQRLRRSQLDAGRGQPGSHDS